MNLAPNGKPSNLTPEQYKLVRTPAFKKWFGDWENSPETASKVVDENGEPKVMYHGSFKTFNVFETPSYFSESKEMAKNFGSITPYFLSIKKPNYGGHPTSNEKIMMLKWLKENSYDGIINKFDTPLVVFVIYPEQIKLADGTNITFDANNPDIRYSDGGNINDFTYEIGGL